MRGKKGQKPMMTTKELADFVGVAANTPLNWRKKGTGPKFVRVGPRNIRYFRRDVEGWLEQRASQQAAR